MKPGSAIPSQDLVCPACGEHVRPGQQFCPACRAYLWREPDEAGPPRSQPAIPSTPVDPTAAPPGRPAASVSPRPTSRVRHRGPARSFTSMTPDPPTVPTPVAARPADELSCPECRHQREAGRRFCAGCGHQFISVGEVSRASTTGSAAEQRVRARTAARAFRRSLPVWYRWRRMLVVLAAVGLVGGGVVVVGPNPRQWLTDHWHELRGTVVPVKVIGVTATPEAAKGADSRPDHLIDGAETMWTVPWPPAAPTGSCAAGPGPRIVLRFEPTRVANLVIHAGAPVDQPDRLQRFRPRTISYGFDGGVCRTAQLRADGTAEVIAVDSGAPVSRLDLVIVDAYAPPADGAQPTLSVTEIAVQSRP